MKLTATDVLVTTLASGVDRTKCRVENAISVYMQQIHVNLVSVGGVSDLMDYLDSEDKAIVLKLEEKDFDKEKTIRAYGKNLIRVIYIKIIKERSKIFSTYFIQKIIWAMSRSS